MTGLTAAEQADARQKRAEARAQRREPESSASPRALVVDAAAIKRRDELASELLSYYEFLTTMYLPDDCIKRPPEGGWPSITAERLAFMGKTDAVIDLLKHIPYISEDNEYQVHELSFCSVLEYAAKQSERATTLEDRDAMDPLPEFLDPALWDRFAEPQHISALIRSAASGDVVFFDTSDGQLAVIDFIDCDCVIYGKPKESFEGAKDSLRRLVFPTKLAKVLETDRHPDGNEDIDAVKKVFEKHGWPTDGHQKEACMVEVARLWNYSFPRGKPRMDTTYQIGEKSICNDYTGKYFQRSGIGYRDNICVEPQPEFLEDEEDEFYDRLSAMQHIAVLARSYSRDGGYIFVDTRDWQLTTIDFMRPSGGNFSPPKEFFESKKDAFRQLALFPTGPTDVRFGSSEKYSDILSVFKKHGWPTAEYQKGPCMDEVAKLWRSY